jgi:hypothetical protein
MFVSLLADDVYPYRDICARARMREFEKGSFNGNGYKVVGGGSCVVEDRRVLS